MTTSKNGHGSSASDGAHDYTNDVADTSNSESEADEANTTGDPDANVEADTASGGAP
jgi:hypothetical protein